jgi:hypothetical protein
VDYASSELLRLLYLATQTNRVSRRRNRSTKEVVYETNCSESMEGGCSRGTDRRAGPGRWMAQGASPSDVDSRSVAADNAALQQQLTAMTPTLLVQAGQ